MSNPNHTDFMITVITTSYLDIRARDAEHARAIAERRVPREFGGRTAEIQNVEVITS